MKKYFIDNKYRIGKGYIINSTGYDSFNCINKLITEKVGAINIALLMNINNLLSGTTISFFHSFSNYCLNKLCKKSLNADKTL